MITGKTLINLGFKPDKWFKEAIEYANENNLEGDILMDFLNQSEPIKAEYIELYDKPVSYNKNIIAETSNEIENVKSVFETMDELMKTPTVVSGAVMPDACPTGGIGQIPVGGVVVTKNAIHPAMHSADICCSVMMTNFGKTNPKDVLDAVHSTAHFGAGGRPDLFYLPEPLEERINNNFFLKDGRGLHLAKTHLGTSGDGNSFYFRWNFKEHRRHYNGYTLWKPWIRSAPL